MSQLKVECQAEIQFLVTNLVYVYCLFVCLFVCFFVGLPSCLFVCLVVLFFDGQLSVPSLFILLKLHYIGILKRLQGMDYSVMAIIFSVFSAVIFIIGCDCSALIRACTKKEISYTQLLVLCYITLCGGMFQGAGARKPLHLNQLVSTDP